MNEEISEWKQKIVFSRTRWQKDMDLDSIILQIKRKEVFRNSQMWVKKKLKSNFSDKLLLNSLVPNIMLQGKPSEYLLNIWRLNLVSIVEFNSRIERPFSVLKWKYMSHGIFHRKWFQSRLNYTISHFKEWRRKSFVENIDARRNSNA